MPLPKEVLERIRKDIKKAKSDLVDLNEEIEKARRVGVDVSKLEEKAGELRNTIRQFELVYGA